MRVVLAVMLTLAPVHAVAQECLHGPNETPEQRARRTAAVGAARTINTVQANESRKVGAYLDLAELGRIYDEQAAKRPPKTPLNFAPGAEILPGWELSLSRGEKTYWFVIKDKTDPCGFAYISNEQGIIYGAEPLR
jgi:hypothetical protein